MTNLALNPFKKGKKTEVEGVRKVDASGSPLEKAINEHNNFDKELIYSPLHSKELKKLFVPVLSPKKIKLFLDYLVSTDSIRSKIQCGDVTGFYLNNLIKNSYDEGNSDFSLDFHNTEIGSVGNMLWGEDNDYINLTIKGNLGYDCFYNAYALNVNVTGNAKSGLGEYAKKCNFTINGSVDGYCGRRVENCDFLISGKAGENLGSNAKKSNFIIHGGVTGPTGNYTNYCTFTFKDKVVGFFGHISDYSTYRTHIKEDFDNFYYDDIGTNKLQLLNKKGKVIKSTWLRTPFNRLVDKGIKLYDKLK